MPYKAGQAFSSFKNILKSKEIRLKTKLHLFSNNALTTLLYGCEVWKTTKPICYKLAYDMSWTSSSLIPYRTLNYTRLAQLVISAMRWKKGLAVSSEWRHRSVIPRVAMHWTPPRKQWIGRLKETHRQCKRRCGQTVTWGQLKKQANDWQQWRARLWLFVPKGDVSILMSIPGTTNVQGLELGRSPSLKLCLMMMILQITVRNSSRISLQILFVKW